MGLNSTSLATLLLLCCFCTCYLRRYSFRNYSSYSTFISCLTLNYSLLKLSCFKDLYILCSRDYFSRNLGSLSYSYIETAYWVFDLLVRTFVL